MTLNSKDTCWVLLLPVPYENDGAPEQRHILDLLHGVSVLIKKGVDSANIFIIIDGNNRSQIESLTYILLNRKFRVYSTEEYDSLRTKTNSYARLFLFVFGHGNEYGLASYRNITPYKLINSISSKTSFKEAAVFIAPCFSGVFNFMPVSSKENNGCEIIVIGSTKFYYSISSLTTENIFVNKLSWQADIFMLSIFKWFEKPEDIDGDGKYTILDLYKYASISANRINTNTRKDGFLSLVDTVPRNKKKIHRYEKIYLNNRILVSLIQKMPSFIKRILLNKIDYYHLIF